MLRKMYVSTKKKGCEATKVFIQDFRDYNLGGTKSTEIKSVLQVACEHRIKAYKGKKKKEVI